MVEKGLPRGSSRGKCTSFSQQQWNLALRRAHELMNVHVHSIHSLLSKVNLSAVVMFNTQVSPQTYLYADIFLNKKSTYELWSLGQDNLRSGYCHVGLNILIQHAPFFKESEASLSFKALKAKLIRIHLDFTSCGVYMPVRSVNLTRLRYDFTSQVRRIHVFLFCIHWKLD